MKIAMNDPVILTRHGEYVNLLDPQPATIDVRDIACALANINRYTGHTTVPYSVAEHSIRVAELLKAEGYSVKSQLAGLLHDATEAYLGDVSSPLKSILPDYRALEKNLESVIELKFNVLIHNRPEVKAADMNLLCAERHALMPAVGDWQILAGMDPDYVQKQLCNHFKRGKIQWGNRTPGSVAKWFMICFNKLVTSC